MQRLANELLEEMPVGVSSATAQVLVSSLVVVGASLGLSLAIGLVLISPGCGLPT